MGNHPFEIVHEVERPYFTDQWGAQDVRDGDCVDVFVGREVADLGEFER